MQMTCTNPDCDKKRVEVRPGTTKCICGGTLKKKKNKKKKRPRKKTREQNGYHNRNK